jgi:hypothetical protein
MNIIRILEQAGSFAEDKDVAADLRQKILMPALERGEDLQVDFEGVEGATQSFIHAMISEIVRRMGGDILERIEFRNCSATVRSVIEIVAEYSQIDEGIAGQG